MVDVQVRRLRDAPASSMAATADQHRAAYLDREIKDRAEEAVALAEALFDNVPEHPWELAFRRGDVLQVLQRRPHGLEGWWLCRHPAGPARLPAASTAPEGLAASNRLRLLAPSPASPTGLHALPRRIPTPARTQLVAADYDIPKPALKEKTRPSQTSARAGRRTPSSDLPLNTGTEPRAQNAPDASFAAADYDQPKPVHFAPDSPPTLRAGSHNSAFYPASYVPHASAFSPPSSNGSSGSSRFSMMTTSDAAYSSQSDRGRSSAELPSPTHHDYADLPAAATPAPETRRTSLLAKEGDYDYIDADVAAVEDHYDRLPGQRALPVNKKKEAIHKKRASFIKNVKLYDVLPRQFRPVSFHDDAPSKASTTAPPSAHTRDEQDNMTLPIYEPLNVTKQAAIRRITFMQSQVQTELSRLFSFVAHPQWFELARLEQRLREVKVCCEYLITHLNNLIRFVLQALQTLLNVSRSQSAQRGQDVDATAALEERLRGLIDAVYRGCAAIREALGGMESVQWKAGDTAVRCLEEIVAAGQMLTENVRKMTAFVLGNAQLIFSETEELKLQLRPLPGVPRKGLLDQEELGASLDMDNEYEDVDYGNVSMPLQPRSPKLERRILNSYIQEVNEQVAGLTPLMGGFVERMFRDRTVTSLFTIEQAELIASHAGKLARLTESLNRNLTSKETEQLRHKLKKIGTYISTGCKRFNLELRAATKTPDTLHFNNVKSSLDYLSELCMFLKNSTETEV